MQYNQLDVTFAKLNVQLSFLVACASCVVFGRTKQDYRGFVKSMALMIFLSELASYTWNQVKFTVGEDKAITSVILAWVSFEADLVFPSLVYWTLAFKYLVTSTLLLSEAPRCQIRELRRKYQKCNRLIIAVIVLYNLVGGTLAIYRELESDSVDRRPQILLFRINNSVQNTISCVIIMLSIRNFRRAIKMGRSTVSSKQNTLNLALLTLYCITGIVINVFGLAVLLAHMHSGVEAATIANNVGMIQKKIGSVYILSILSQVEDNVQAIKETRARPAPEVVFSDGSEEEEMQFTDDLEQKSSASKEAGANGEQDQEQQKTMEQRIRDRLLLSTNSSDFDERQSLHVNLLNLEDQEKSLDEIEEEGITYLFVQRRNTQEIRKHIRENKDATKIRIRKKRPIQK